MSAWLLYALSGVLVLMIALRGLFAHERMVGKIIAANLMASGLFLVFVAVARRTRYSAPDPVPHALVLTGIVVSVSATALALAIVRRLAESPEDERMQESGAFRAESGEPPP